MGKMQQWLTRYGWALETLLSLHDERKPTSAAMVVRMGREFEEAAQEMQANAMLQGTQKADHVNEIWEFKAQPATGRNIFASRLTASRV